jgi:hypothetical protein
MSVSEALPRVPDPAPPSVASASDPWFGPLAALCGLMVSVPFWVGRFLPFLDLPQHLALAAVLRHGEDPAWGFAPYFEAQWGEFTP